VDYFETDPAVDAKQIGIEGLSPSGNIAAAAPPALTGRHTSPSRTATSKPPLPRRGAGGSRTTSSRPTGEACRSQSPSKR